MQAKYLLSAIICIITLQLQAQTEKGDFLVAGSLGLSLGSSHSEISGVTYPGPSTLSLNLGLEGGYFIVDNIAIGVGTGLNFFKTKQDFESDTVDTYSQINTTNSFSAGIFARYYYANSSLWHLWGDLSTAYSHGTSKSELTGAFPYKVDGPVYNGFAVGITPGATIMVGKKMGIELSYGWLGFSHLSSHSEGDFPQTITSNTFSFNWNSFGFGVVYHI